MLAAFKPLGTSITRSVILAVGILVGSIAGFSISVRAENSVVLNASTASVHVDFVILIPEALSLEIGNTNRLTTAPHSGSGIATQATATLSSTPTSVSATGTLAHGGTMALTIEDSDPDAAHHQPPIPLSAITWTSGGVDSTGELKQGAAAIHSYKKATAHTYTFKGLHSHDSNQTGKTITYTLSSP